MLPVISGLAAAVPALYISPHSLDCCQAFIEAVAAIGRQGTLMVPAGRYIIRQQLNINNRVVLRGETTTKLSTHCTACQSCGLTHLPYV